MFELVDLAPIVSGTSRTLLEERAGTFMFAALSTYWNFYFYFLASF